MRFPKIVKLLTFFSKVNSRSLEGKWNKHTHLYPGAIYSVTYIILLAQEHKAGVLLRLVIK